MCVYTKLGWQNGNFPILITGDTLFIGNCGRSIKIGMEWKYSTPLIVWPCCRIPQWSVQVTIMLAPVFDWAWKKVQCSNNARQANEGTASEGLWQTRTTPVNRQYKRKLWVTFFSYQALFGPCHKSLLDLKSTIIVLNVTLLDLFLTMETIGSVQHVSNYSPWGLENVKGERAAVSAFYGYIKTSILSNADSTTRHCR